jgi:hypothetical protein
MDGDTKTCPSCGDPVDEASTECPECGARWAGDGTYLGVPESPVFFRTPSKKVVAEMTQDELGSLIFRKAFWGAVAGILAVAVTLWLLGLAFAGCMSGID